jgi:hypothetical protein
VALVDSEFTLNETGRPLLRRLSPFYPALAIMLVSVEKNGFRAWADFQTHEILALVQTKKLHFTEVDTDAPPEEELPF